MLHPAGNIQAAHAAIESGELDLAYALLDEVDAADSGHGAETRLLRHRIAAERAKIPPDEVAEVAATASEEPSAPEPAGPDLPSPEAQAPPQQPTRKRAARAGGS